MPPRYCPARPFPPYAYVPGRTPHPVTDPAGHAHGRPARGRPEREPARIPAERWKENEEYLYGVDLFNAGFYWEAHEAWEGVWKASREADQAQATFVQGLILIAAAQLKRGAGAAGAARALAGEGLERVKAVYDATGAGYLGVGYMGVTPAAVADAALAALEGGSPAGSEPPRLALVL